jgi:uncharacterized protein (TIGR02099 family)
MTKLLRRLAHYAVYLVAAGVIVVSLVALGLRMWIMPDIDRYRPALERLVSQETGLPVTIGAIQAGWEGINPSLRLEDVSFTPPGQPPALSLPRVDAKLSWTTLLLGRIRLSILDINSPHLVIHRDAQRNIYIAGIPINRPGGQNPFPDWLLSQPLVVVRKATVVWQDDFLHAPPLTLSDLNLVLYDRFGRHRLGLTARPPDLAGRRLDLRADFTGRTVRRLDQFKGQVYASVENASAEALRTWAPWAQEAVREGVGSFRMWLNFSNRHISSVIGDVRLNRVKLRLAEDLPEIKFLRVAGRIGWKQTPDGQDFYVEHLDFASHTGQATEPASVRVHLTPGAQGEIAGARVQAEDLRLEALTALSGAVPLPTRVHDLIESLKPRGFVQNLQLDWMGKARYHLEARFQNVGIHQSGELPGLTGVSGEIQGNQEAGEAWLDSKQLHLEYDKVFRNPLDFDRLQAEIAWNQGKGGQQVRINGLRMINPDLDGEAQGTILLRPHAAPVADITAHLTRGAGNQVWRYLPRQIADDAYDWVKRSILSGGSPDTRLTLRGPLDAFPFDQGGGVFRVAVKLANVEVKFAPDWPPIEDINGWLIFHDKAMEIQAKRGRTLGIPLTDVKGIVPDIHHGGDKVLSIGGRAAGSAQDLLDYVRASPVFEYTDRFTAPMQAQGPAQLVLNLTLPLRDMDRSTVSGVLKLAGTTLNPGDGLPVLSDLNGKLIFTHRDIKGRDISTQVFGQPASIDVESVPGGRVNVVMKGRITPQGLAGRLPQAALRHLSGDTRYRAEVSLHQHKGELKVSSDLKGLAIDLPEPLKKSAEQSVPLLVTRSETGQGRDVIMARYGQILSARALLGGNVPRVSVRVGGGEAAAPKADGLTLTAVDRRIDLDAWRALADQVEGSSGALPIHSIELTANELVAGGRLLRDTHVLARTVGDTWHLQVAGREIRGDVQLHTTGDTPEVRARLKYLTIPEKAPGQAGESTSMPDISHLRLDIAADSLVIKGKEVGRLKLAAEPGTHGLRVDSLALSNPDASLEGEGLLADNPLRPTEFSLKGSSPDLGKLLSQLGYPGLIKRGAMKVEGSIGWMGGLRDMALGDISGDLDLSMKNGQFVKLHPGAAKLLGILSLQAIPRRISLDFRDVFSEGFAFDEISAPIYLDKGIAYLSPLTMNGPSASIHMKGEINLVRGTQILRVSVEPHLEDTLAAGALLVNPAVGLGALVASKVLKNPISRAATFEYLVTGTWDDPTVKKLSRSGPSQNGNHNLPGTP